MSKTFIYINNRKTNDPEGEWWELWDDTTNLPYYYHTKTCITEWDKPIDKHVISLVKIQVFFFSFFQFYRWSID